MMRLMDIWTCAKSLRSPDLHTKEHGRRKDFSREGNTGFCQVAAKRIFFQEWANSGEIYFYQLVTNKQTFFY